MKDYKRIIIWTDYFNSSLTRSKGRRIPLSKSIKNPQLKDLEKASKKAGYNPKSFNQFHPKRMNLPTGYISIERLKSKNQTIREISSLLSKIVSEQKMN